MAWNDKNRRGSRQEPNFGGQPPQDAYEDPSSFHHDGRGYQHSYDDGYGYAPDNRYAEKPAKKSLLKRLMRQLFLGVPKSTHAKKAQGRTPAPNHAAAGYGYDDYQGYNAPAYSHAFEDEDMPPRNRRGGGKPPRNKRPRKRRSLFGRMIRWSFTLGLWGVVAIGALIAYEATKLPPIQDLKIPPRPPSIALIGTDGTLMATRGEGRGKTVVLQELPPYLPQAFIAIEDRRYYSHFGFDPVGLTRALVTNLRAGASVQGGSTLTQQLAKNLFLSPERSLERKIQELILSVWLEAKLGKDEILELYLNRVYFGSGAYGIEAAAQRYFNKPAAHVTLAEAAMLAGLVKAPSRLAPTRDREAAEARAKVVMGAMVEAGFITAQQSTQALNLSTAIAKPQHEGSIGYVADWVMDQLNDLVGTVEQDIIVDTTIDPVLQAEAEQALVNGLDKKGTGLGVTQGSVVSIDPQGAVKAMVGGRSYAQSQFNRAVNARRQPGSTFKPFVYLTALERGLTPETIREDAPITLGKWSPSNFDHKFRGPVTLTQALATSLNTVAVSLGNEFGPSTVVSMAHRLGIKSKLEPNASISLGTSAVSPLEMTNAFTPFANGGYGVEAYVIKEIRAAESGEVLYQHMTPGIGQVIEPDIVGMMNMMMTETMRIGTARRAELAGWPAAGKTGTSQDFRDAWFVGYTAHLVTTVWLGNDDNSPTKRASGSNLPVEVWSQFMTAAHQGIAVAALPGNYMPADNDTPYYDDPYASTGGNVPYDHASGGRPYGGQQGQPQEQGGSPFGFIKKIFGGG